MRHEGVKYKSIIYARFTKANICII